MRNQEIENYPLTRTSRSSTAMAGIPYLLVGGGIGAALALLFAPKSGTELRGEISDVTKRGIDATREKAIELRSQSADAIGSLREKADGIYQYASTRLGKSQEALDLATFETAMAEEHVRPLADRSNTIAASKPSNGKSSNIM